MCVCALVLTDRHFGSWVNIRNDVASPDMCNRFGRPHKKCVSCDFRLTKVKDSFKVFGTNSVRVTMRVLRLLNVGGKLNILPKLPKAHAPLPHSAAFRRLLSKWSSVVCCPSNAKYRARRHACDQKETNFA